VLLANDKLPAVTFTDPSNALQALLDRLPDGRSVGLAEPGTAPDPDEIVLAVGTGGQSVPQLLQAAAAARAAAVVLDEQALKQLTSPVVVPVVGRPPEVSWRSLHAALSARLGQPQLLVRDELADLAQTIAVLTGGLVIIEDTASGVLAYSRSSDEVDELRRRSILGRSGPPEYLALLRQWGVYDRLAAAEDVVEIAEHPASGVRRRLAVGIFAGRRQLGTIWVQQGNTEFGPQASQALLGAARLAAAQLIDPGRPRAAGKQRLANFLAAGGSVDVLELGRDARRPCAVAIITTGEADTELMEIDPVARTERVDELASILTVHSAAFRRNAIVERSGSEVLVLLPGLSPAQDKLPNPQTMLTQAVTAARRLLGQQVRAALGPIVDSPAKAPDSARAARAVLNVADRDPVLSFEAARNRLLTSAVQDCLEQQRYLLDSRVTALIDSDPESARTLLRYLDTGSDVSRVATEFGVHPTTVRYRLRRTTQQLDIDLSDPDDRLSILLQLRYGLRSGPYAG
jgi:DNA-binding PucR family transcriptional regulator